MLDQAPIDACSRMPRRARLDSGERQQRRVVGIVVLGRSGLDGDSTIDSRTEGIDRSAHPPGAQPRSKPASARLEGSTSRPSQAPTIRGFSSATLANPRASSLAETSAGDNSITWPLYGCHVQVSGPSFRSCCRLPMDVLQCEESVANRVAEDITGVGPRTAATVGRPEIGLVHAE
jgi:hypothetical protein